MKQPTFEERLAAELKKFGCEYRVTVADILREFAELDLKTQAAALDPEDLALSIMNNVNEAGILELVQTAIRTAVSDMLVQRFAHECEAAFVEIEQEAAHG